MIAQSKKAKKPVGRPPKPLPTRRRVRTVTKVSIDAPAIQHANMLLDPCGADLVPTVYTGDKGYINRFTNIQTVGLGPGETCGYILYKPGNALQSQFSQVNPALATTVGFGGANFTGSNFLNTNSSKLRCGAFCVSMRPNSAPNTATGTISFGNVSAASIANLSTPTINALASLCTETVSAAAAVMQPLEVNWVPGSFDDRYSPYQVTDDDSDRNCLLVVFTGFPAATGINWRATSVMEWVPKVDLGIAFDATAIKPSECDKDCVIRYLQSRDRNWWFSLGKRVLKTTTRALRGYASGGLLGAAATFV